MYCGGLSTSQQENFVLIFDLLDRQNELARNIAAKVDVESYYKFA